MTARLTGVRKRFRNRILKFLVVSSFLPVLVWLVILYFESLGFLGSFVEKELRSASSEAVLRIETWKHRNETILKFLQQQLANAGYNPREWKTILKSATNTDPSIYAATIMDLKGQCIARSDDLKTPRYDDRLYFKKALTGQVYHEFLISKLHQHRAMCSAIPLWFESSKTITNVVVLCTFVDHILPHFGNLKLGETGHIAIVDDLNRVIVHPNLEMMSTRLSPAEKKILEAGHSNPHGNRYEFKVDGKRYVSYVRSLDNGWTIMAMQERSEIVAIAKQYLKQPIVLAGLTIVVLGFLTFLAIDKSTRPLSDLTQAANELGKANFGVRVPITSNDEVGVLAHSFNSMAERLQSTFQELKEKEMLLERHFDDLNQKVSEQSQKLLYSAKMSCLGEMAGSIAHEINNPLAIISLLTQKMRGQVERGQGSNSFILEHLVKIERTCLRITQIIRGLRAFSRDGSKDPIIRENLSSIIQDTAALCMESIRSKKIRMDVNCSENIEIECQPIQISQVILNLISNAKDATANLNERWIRIDVFDLDDLVQISITDSGRGVPESLREKIMQPFFTTKKVGEGTGLGLSICKGIVEQHHGRLFLNVECPNTQFVLVLPKALKRKPQQMKRSSSFEADLIS